MTSKLRAATRLARLTGRNPRLFAAEVAHRSGRAIRRRRLRRGFDRLIAAVPDGARFDPPAIDLPPLADLPPELREAAGRTLRDAEDVAVHRMAFLGSGPVEYGPEIDWLADPLTGHRWPVRLHFDIPISDPASADDPKRAWELSRGHQLLILARAVRLDPEGSARWMDELQAQITSWIEANPVGRTINWTTAMEAGIRAANWVTALGIAGTDRLDPAFVARVSRSLQQHGRFIAWHLEGSPRMRSNHFAGDLLGLAALGTTLRGDRETSRWRDAARRWLPREVEAQVRPDGGDFEASIPYHGLVLEMFALTLRLLERDGWEAPPATRERLRRMVDLGRGVRHPSGRAPQFGDGDSGRILPQGFGRRPTLDPVLWTAAAILDLPRALPGPPDPEVALNLGLAAWSRFERDASHLPPPPAAFPASGLFALRGSRSLAVVDCGDVGQAGNGGHAHNDALALEFSLDGVEVIVDPGTYAYTADRDARNAMRSTAAHATPMVDGEEINPIDPRRMFQLDEVSAPTVRAFEEKEEALTLRAAHEAFRRLADPVTVERTVTVGRESGILEIVDRFAGAGRHSISIAFTFAPGWVAEPSGPGRVTLTREGEVVEFRVEGATVERSREWYSPTFGVRELTEGAKVTATLDLPEAIKIQVRPVEQRGEPEG